MYRLARGCMKLASGESGGESTFEAQMLWRHGIHGMHMLLPSLNRLFSEAQQLEHGSTAGVKNHTASRGMPDIPLAMLCETSRSLVTIEILLAVRQVIDVHDRLVGTGLLSFTNLL